MAAGEFGFSDMVGCILGFVVEPGSDRSQLEDKESGRREGLFPEGKLDPIVRGMRRVNIAL